MSYWTATNKIPIAQKSVRIPADNGVNYSAGQEIRIRIDPGLKFFNPQQTMLEADVVILPPTYSTGTALNSIKPTRLQLDAETGFQSLCRTVRIHDSNGTLLEEIDNYNTLVSVMYDYHTNNSLRGKRALTEGSTAYTPDTRGSEGTTKSVQNDYHTNPYFTPPSKTSPISASFSKDDFISAKVIIPIHTGIFQNDKIFPNMLMGGITLTILLEDNRYCFRQLESVNRFRKLNLNPEFYGVTSAGASWPSGSGKTSVFLNDVNSQYLDVGQCPFVIGEKIGFERTETSASGTTVVVWAAATGAPEITDITFSGGAVNKLSLTLGPVSASAITGDGPDNASDWYVYSNSIAESTSYNPTYRVENVALIVQEIDAGVQYENEMMKKMREGGVINYDFLSYTCYKYSQLASDRVANIRIPIENSRAKSILCVPLDSTPYSSKQILECKDTYKIEHEHTDNNPTNYRLRSCRPNLEGIVDHITNYQFLYDGRLQPNRRVDLTRVSSKKAISGQHMIELDKSLSQAGINGHSMARFNSNFVIGRALALGDAVYRAIGKDFSLQVNYQETTAPTKAKLWCNYVAHIRRIEVKSGNVSVIV